MRYFRPAQLILTISVAFTAFAAPSNAATPQVTTDIAPVYGLVAQVMKGVGSPSLIIRPGRDPHHYSLRPSEAANIQNADIIFWIGTELTPWLKPAFRNLAGNAETISLLNAPGIRILEAGEDGHHHGAAHDTHDGHDHDKHDEHDHDKHDGHDHDKHDEHDHDKHDGHDHDKHDGHDHDKHDGHDHDKHDDHDDHDKHNDQEAIDPHAWLDPENARIWIRVIAQELSHHDPAHAAAYQANADQAEQEIINQQTRIDTILATQQMPPVFVQHAAYAYFENRFNLQLAGALYDRENEAPSPSHIAELHAITETMPKSLPAGRKLN